jgi:exopolysaccharide production protein ExoZ
MLTFRNPLAATLNAGGTARPALVSLQCGRAVAALAVVAFHLSGMIADPRFGGAAAFSRVTGRGYLGVDFFFVLSGFILLFAHERDIGHPERLGTYALKRGIRIYPVYWLFLLVTVAGAMLTDGVTALPETPGDLLSAVTLVHWNGFSNPLRPAWTLYHEVLFYAAFALLLVRRWLGWTAFALWAAAVLIRFRYAEHGGWSFTETLLSASNLSFACGIAAFYLHRRLDGARGTAALAAGAVLFAVLLVLGRGGELSALHQFGFSIAFLLAIAGAVAMERAGRLLSLPGLALLGDASYALYLSHEGVGTSLIKLAAAAGAVEALNHRLLYVLVLAAIVAFAVLFHLVVEKPLLRWLAERLGVRRNVAARAPG